MSQEKELSPLIRTKLHRPWVAGFQIKFIAAEERVHEPLTEGTFYGVGGQRVEPTTPADILSEQG